MRRIARQNCGWNPDHHIAGHTDAQSCQDDQFHATIRGIRRQALNERGSGDGSAVGQRFPGWKPEVYRPHRALDRRLGVLCGRAWSQWSRDVRVRRISVSGWPDDAAEAEMGGRGVDRLGEAERRPVAPAAACRAILVHLPWDGDVRHGWLSSALMTPWAHRGAIRDRVRRRGAVGRLPRAPRNAPTTGNWRCLSRVCNVRPPESVTRDIRHPDDGCGFHLTA